MLGFGRMKHADADTPLFRLLGRRVAVFLALLGAVVGAGTLGYRELTHGRWLDCLYMTVITLSTIGYGEILDLSANPAARVFTILLIVFGVGVFTYVLTTVTQFATDPELRAAWRRRRMQQILDRMSGHYILAGWGPTAEAIIRELRATRRPAAVLTEDPAPARACGAGEPDLPLIAGDGCDDALLEAAGIARAAGVFAVCADDHANIVLCLSARRLNPRLRIIASLADERNRDKMLKAGADAVVSSRAIGGLRMASEMVRPSVVTFLDTMLRDAARSLRIEELPVGEKAAGRAIADLPLNASGRSLLVALRRGPEWTFNPTPDERLRTGDVLVIMASAEARADLEARCGVAAAPAAP